MRSPEHKKGLKLFVVLKGEVIQTAEQNEQTAIDEGVPYVWALNKKNALRKLVNIV